MNIEDIRKSQVIETNESIHCPNCKSQQVVSFRRGYSLLKGIKIFVLSLVIFLAILAAMTWASIPLAKTEWSKIAGITQLIVMFGAILVVLAIRSWKVIFVLGLIGRKKLLNYCARCGHEWFPRKGR